MYTVGKSVMNYQGHKTNLGLPPSEQMKSKTVLFHHKKRHILEARLKHVILWTHEQISHRSKQCELPKKIRQVRAVDQGEQSEAPEQVRPTQGELSIQSYRALLQSIWRGLYIVNITFDPVWNIKYSRNQKQPSGRRLSQGAW